MKRLFSCLIFFVLLISACTKETSRIGCTDYLAINFDANAQEDDESCIYPELTQGVYVYGEPSGWNGNILLGGFERIDCLGSTHDLEQTYFTLDSAYIDPVSGDTLPAGTQLPDSTFEGGLAVVSNNEGYFRSYISLVNPVNAKAYVNGNLNFDIKLANDSTIATVDFFIHGKNVLTTGQCVQYQTSDLQTISVIGVTDTSYVSASLPILGFEEIYLNGISTLFGVQGQGIPNDTILVFNNINWTNF